MPEPQVKLFLLINTGKKPVKVMCVTKDPERALHWAELLDLQETDVTIAELDGDALQEILDLTEK